LDPEPWTLDYEPWTLDPGPWTPDSLPFTSTSLMRTKPSGRSKPCTEESHAASDAALQGLGFRV